MHQTITKEKPVRPVVSMAAQYGVTPREMNAMGQLSNSADAFGVKSVGIGKGPFGVGCCMKMSGKADYEVMVDGHGSVMLGRVEASGKRTKLHESGSSVEATWDAILDAVKRSEAQQ